MARSQELRRHCKLALPPVAACDNFLLLEANLFTVTLLCGTRLVILFDKRGNYFSKNKLIIKTSQWYTATEHSQREEVGSLDVGWLGANLQGAGQQWAGVPRGRHALCILQCKHLLSRGLWGAWDECPGFQRKMRGSGELLVGRPTSHYGFQNRAPA